MARLDRNFYCRDTLTVAREIIGTYLVRSWNGKLLVCRITEAEAYIGATDKACHAYGGRCTERTKTLYAAPGTSYVYLIYGMHHCLNFVTEEDGIAAAVLIRGAIPVAGIDEIAYQRFGVNENNLTAYQRKNFLNGPGKLCRGLAITKAHNALPLDNDQLWLCDELPELLLAPYRPIVHTGKRIGIDYAEEAIDFPWRFYESQS